MIAKLTSWLQNFGLYILELLYNVCIDLAQAVIDGLSTAALLIVELFPAGDSAPSPGSLPVSETAELIIQCLNWVFPIAYLSSLVGFVVTAVLAYAIIAPLARWFKLIT